MNRFTADYSSSLPSTPDAKTPPFKTRPAFAGTGTNLSTTPAGPPPSSAASFTPAGPPPSSFYGGSQFGSGVSKLKLTKDFNDSLGSSTSSDMAMPPPPRTKNGTPAKSFGEKKSKAPGSSLFLPGDSFRRSNGEGTTSDDDEYGDEEGHIAGMEESTGTYGEIGSPAFKGFTSVNARPMAAPKSLQFQRSSQSAKRSRLQLSTRKEKNMTRVSKLPRKGKDSVIPSVARDLASRSESAALEEPDEMILRTEDAIGSLNEEIRASPDPDIAQTAISTRAIELVIFWQSYSKFESFRTSTAGIGPGDSASSIQKASFLSSLLLALHHPPPSQPPSISSTRYSSSRSLSLVPASSPSSAPIPQVLLEWLDKYHVSYDDLLRNVRSASPNCTAHELFWDAVQSLVLRGKLQDVMQLFSEADFQYAVTALDDGGERPGYAGARLQTVQGMVYRARQVLDGCPGSRYGDWQVDGSEWDLYRKRVSSELEYLMQAAEGPSGDDEDEVFQAENFGIRKTGNALIRSSQKPQRNVPWSIYQNLKIMYSILLGSAVEIIAQSLDWLEATTALTVWWDGSEEDTIASWSLNVSRSQRPNEPQLNEDPYLSRLSASFLCVTDPDDKDAFQINTMSLLEVGLGSVLQGNVEGALTSLRTYSLCIAAAVAEIGSLAGWLGSSDSSKPAGLNQEDLMVLSYGVDPVGVRKDDILIAYAEALFEREELRTPDGVVREGWELSISITSRLDDDDLVRSTTSHFLYQLPLINQQRMDKLVSLCTELGLEEEARKVSERYGDHLVNNTTQYGTALVCYSRSHSAAKIRLLVDLLVSYSLVQSAAYPPSVELDHNLKALVDSPKYGLSGLLQVDPDAAEMLSFYLSGYACLRRFYNLRDEGILAKAADRKPNMRPLARRRAAAKALTAVINSAADSIYGGLYDAERQSAIQVDGLLTLFGEATAFIAGDEGKRTLNASQMYALLAAIEDLQTVNLRVYDATEECLQAALRNYHGSAPPSPHAMLKKSVSSGANSNFSFSFMGSEMLGSESAGGKSMGSSGVMVGSGSEGEEKVDMKVEREGDWRAGFREKGASGKDVLETLRLGIARELSLAELEEDASTMRSSYD